MGNLAGFIEKASSISEFTVGLWISTQSLYPLLYLAPLFEWNYLAKRMVEKHKSFNLSKVWQMHLLLVPSGQNRTK